MSTHDRRGIAAAMMCDQSHPCPQRTISGIGRCGRKVHTGLHQCMWCWAVWRDAVAS